MNNDSIIFEPGAGHVFAVFTWRRWFWGHMLSLSLLLMGRAAAVGVWLDGYGARLFHFAYQTLSLRNPLRAPLWRLALWIEVRAWSFGWVGDLGYSLYTLAYFRSGQEYLDDLNEVISYPLSPARHVVADNWNDVVPFCLSERPAKKKRKGILWS
jgi:hypothetical protein